MATGTLFTTLQKQKPIKKPNKLVTKFSGLLQYFVIAIVAIIATLSVELGQYFILAFGAYVFIFKKDSRIVFAIALFLLISIPFFQIVNQSGVADNIAVYVFGLLVVGTLKAILELILNKD